MQMPSLAGVEEALSRLRRFVPETPLVRSELLSRALEAEIWLKNETVSPVASFKLRGALTELLRARASRSVFGAVTSSTGNHGQGVAYAARLLGVAAHVFLPVNANPVKRAMIQAFGARVVEVGHDLDAAKAEAREFAARHGHSFVDDGEGLGVMEGGGTVGLEAARALEGIDWLLVPMGSGSLVSGCAAAVKALQPRCRVVAVQAKGSPAMVESFHAKRPVERPAATVADGLICREPAALALAALIQHVDDALLAHDEELLGATHSLAALAHVLVEPSGAAALAAAVRLRQQVRGQRVVLVLTGSNVTMDTLHRALQMPLLVQTPVL